MTVAELIEKLQTFPPELEIVTDNHGGTKLEPVGEPQLDYGVMVGGEYQPGRASEKGAVPYVYIPGPGF